MKERPILFSAPMVRAILEGRKTVTLRIVKGIALECLTSANFTPTYVAMPENDMCPYGQPGDRLWVRETWQYFGFSDEGEPCICYLADHGRAWPHVPQSEADKVDCIWADLSDPGNFSISGRACDNRWRPSIHMPRWASRITLEVTGVRVERLQEINEADAVAEGIQPFGDGGYHVEDGRHYMGTARDSFASLWESINGDGSWDANPWVWVVKFKRMESA